MIRVIEGKQYLVNRINFAGNTKTRDKVLRREMLLEEQTPFNGDALDLSILRLNQLGFFERIEEKDHEVIKRPADEEADILVKVKERSQQSISLTGGVSGLSGSFLGVSYQSNNFRGLGQQIDVQLLAGTRTSSYVFRFTEPYFLDSKTSLGVSLFTQRLRFDTLGLFSNIGVVPNENVSLFTRINTGFDVSASHPFWRWTRLGLSYSLQTIRIDDVDERFSPFAFNQLLLFTPGGDVENARKGIIRSEVTASLSRNTKNAAFGATRGSQFLIRVPVSGGPLGGDFNVVQPLVEYQKFLPDLWLSGGRNTLAFRARFQHIFPFGTLPGGNPMTVPFFERIFTAARRTFGVLTSVRSAPGLSLGHLNSMPREIRSSTPAPGCPPLSRIRS